MGAAGPSDRIRYAVTQRPRDAAPAADYIYDVTRDGVAVAQFRHAFRGDEPMLRAIGGRWRDSINILVLDRPPPHAVSDVGAAALDALLG